MAAAKKATTKKKATKKAGGKKAAGGTIKCGKWVAILDSMPPGTPTLRVTGECTTPTPGYKIRLVAAVPQGKNPRILLLRKVVTLPTGIVPQVITKVEVRYEKKTKTKYTEVTILPDMTTIKVEEVS